VTGKEAARLFVTVGADTSGFQAGMRGVQTNLNQTSQAVNGTMGMFKQFALGQIVGTYALQALNGALGFAKDAIIGYNASLEQAHIGFSTMLGSGEAATKMLKDLQKFAASTPFEFLGLLDSSKRLMAMGFAAEDIIPVMTTVGDAVAGLGAGQEGINRATYALGQMSTAGRINAQDMMQLTSLGIPSWRYLAEAIGVTTAEVRKMSEQGLIPAELGINAILSGMEKDFGGMMSKQATTFTGALSNINDMLEQIIGKGFEPFFTEVSKAAVALATFLQSSGGTQFMNDLNVAVTSVVGTMKEVIGVTFGVVQAFAGFLAANPYIFDVIKAVIALKVVMVALSVITAVIGLIQGLGFALGAVRAAFAIGGVVAGFQAAITLLAPGLVAATAGFGTAAVAAGTFAAALLMNPLTWIVLGIAAVTAALVALGGGFDDAGKKAESGAKKTVEAWDATHGYITSYNTTAEAEAELAGTSYAYSYADGIYKAGPGVAASGQYVAAVLAEQTKAVAVPAMGAAGAAAGAAFGEEMQTAAMVAFRAGEKDISGVVTKTASTWEQKLAEALDKLKMEGVKKSAGNAISKGLSIPPQLFAAMFGGATSGLSGGLKDSADAAIKDLIKDNVAARFVAKLTPKGKAIYEGFAAIKAAMVNGAQEAVAEASAKLLELKNAFKALTDASKAYANEIKSSLMGGISTTLTDFSKRFKEVQTTAETVVAKTMAGITRVIREATTSVTLQPIATAAETVVDQFRTRVNQMENFITNLKKLRDEGLSGTVLRDIIGMGAEGGSALAAAIAEGGKVVVDQINALQSVAEKQAQEFGNILAFDEFGAQIDAAQAAVNSQTGLLDAAKKDLDGALAFDPIKETKDALDALKKGTGAKPRNTKDAPTGAAPTATTTVTVQSLNIGIGPTVPGFGTGEQAQERAMAARIAAEVAKALNNITAVQRSGYVLK
jgi:tape measure domain-containing protein